MACLTPYLFCKGRQCVIDQNQCSNHSQNWMALFALFEKSLLLHTLYWQFCNILTIFAIYWQLCNRLTTLQFIENFEIYCRYFAIYWHFLQYIDNFAIYWQFCKILTIMKKNHIVTSPRYGNQSNSLVSLAVSYSMPTYTQLSLVFPSSQTAPWFPVLYGETCTTCDCSQMAWTKHDTSDTGPHYWTYCPLSWQNICSSSVCPW